MSDNSAAAQALIAGAASGTVEDQIRAGMALHDLIGSGGGSEGGSEGGGGTAFTIQMALQAIEDAISAGTLSQMGAYGLLAGIIGRPSSQYAWQASSELSGLIGGDTSATHQVIGILTIATGIAVSQSTPGNESGVVYYPAQAIASLAALSGTPLLTFQAIADDIHAAVQGGSLPGAPAILLLGRVGRFYDSFSASASVVAAQTLGFIEDGLVPAPAALAALTLVGQSNGGAGAARLLVDVATADPNLAYAAGLGIASLVDTTTPEFALSNARVTARQAVQVVTTGVSSQGLPADSAIVLLTAISTVPGGVVGTRNAMNAASDGVRTLVEGGSISVSDATAAIVSAIGPDGMTATQVATFLIALGGSGNQGPLGGVTGNADLIAGAGLSLAGLIHDRGLSPVVIASAIDAVFAGGITAYLTVDAPSLAILTLVRAAVALEALQSGGLETIGAALALPTQAIGAYAMSGVSDGLQGGTLTSAQAIHILAGFAGAGSDGDRVAAGRELTFILNLSFITPAAAVAQIADAVAAGTLTAAQAILLLAGAATGVPPVGLTTIYTQMAAYMDADPVAGAAVLGDAVTHAALSAADGVSVLAQAAVLGSPSTGEAAIGVLLSWVDGGSITAADATSQLIGLASAGTTSLQGFAGTILEALVGHGGFALADAIALVDGAVPATLDAAAALTVLVHMAASGDATVQVAVQNEIGALITGGDITLQSVIADLQALRPSGSAAVQAVIDEQLAILITDPVTLADTAGLGSPAQVAAAASAIANLFNTDATAAQTIIDALAGRIENSTLTAGQAAQLLAQIYVHGGTGVTPILAAMVDLSTPHGSPAAADIPVGTMVDAVGAQLAGGALTATAAFVAFGQLAAINHPAVNGAVAGLLSAGHLAIDALDAAVDAGAFSPSDAITVLGNVLPDATQSLLTDVLAEIVSLVGTDAALAAQALARFLSLAGNGDHALRLIGHEGIEALAGAVPGIGADAFLQLLSFYPLASTQADTQAVLTALLAGGDLTTAQAIEHIADQLSLSNGAPLINPTQALTLLVGLSAFADARAEIYAYMGQVTAANAAAQASGNPVWGFLPQAAITALANGAGADLGRIAGTATEIARLSAGYLSTGQVVTSLLSAGLLTNPQRISLMAEVAGFLSDTAAAATLGASIAGLISGLSDADQRAGLDGISDLIGDPLDHLSAVKAVALLLAGYGAGAKAASLAELADIGAGAVQPGGVAFAIVSAVAAGTASLANGMDALIGLSVGGTDGFSDAVAIALARALAGGQFSASGVMTALEANIPAGLSARQAIGFLEGVLVARFAETNFQDPGELAATAALQTDILAEINALIATYTIPVTEAVAAMAAAASGASAAVLRVIGGEIAAFLGGHAGSGAQSIAAVVAAAADHAITGPEALALLAGIAIPADAALQAAAGGGVAALVASGAVTENAATVGVYNAYLDGGLPLDHVVGVVAGAWAAGGLSVGAKILDQVETHGFAAYAVLAGQLADAVDAGILAATQMVAGGAAIIVATGDAAGGAAFLSALVTDGLMAADAVLVTLGGSISTSGFTAAQAIAVIVDLADQLPASQAAFGIGVAELVAAGRLAFADVGAALSDALNAGVLSFTEVVTLLIGAAGDTSAAAVTAGIAGQVGTQLVALIGSGAPHFTDVLGVIDTAATGGTLPVSIAIALLGGLAGGGTQSQQLAVGVELGALVANGVTSLDTVLNTLTSEAQNGHISTTGTLFILLQLSDDVEQIASRIDTFLLSQTLAAREATATILAALSDETQPIDLEKAVPLLIQMAERHVVSIDSSDAAVITQAGAALASLVANGDLTASDLLGRLASLPAFGAIPLLAAIEAGAGSGSALGQGAHDMLLGHLTVAQIHEFVASVGQLIGTDGLSAADGLSILVSMSADGVPAQVAVGHELAQLAAGGRATMSEVATALVASGLAPGPSAIVLAGMIDPTSGVVPSEVMSDLQALAIRILPGGAASYRPYVQQLITALKEAVNAPMPLVDATGLSLGQAALALSAFARLGDAEVMADVSSAIATLVHAYPQSQDGVFALLSLSVAAGDGAYTNSAARQLAFLGGALGLTEAQFATAVAGAIEEGLSAGQVIHVLAHLTSINPVNWGGPSDTDLYPHLGIAAGAAIDGLLGDNFTFGQALDLLGSVQGISADNMSLLVLGLASAGTAGDQIAAGLALGRLATGSIFQELALVPDAVAHMVRLGMMAAGGSTGAIIGIGLDDAAIAEILTGLDAAVDAGSLSAADALQALVNMLAGSSRQGDPMAMLRMAVFGELAHLVPSHVSADNAVRTLLTPPSGVTASLAIRMEAEAGAMIAALVKAGGTTPGAVSAAIETAVTSHMLTPDQAVTFVTGAALYHDYTGVSPVSYALHVTLGQYLAGLIEAGTISVDGAMDGIAAVQSSFPMGYMQGEVALLAAVAAHDVAGLQAAVGETLVGLYESGRIYTPLIMSLFDSFVDAPGLLSAQQAKAVLLGMAGSFEGGLSGLSGVKDVAAEFVTLIGRNALSGGEVADDVAAEIHAGHLSMSYGLALMTYLVAGDSSLADSVTNEISALIAGGSLTIDGAIGGLFFAASTQLANDATDTFVVGGIHRILLDLVGQGLLTVDAAVTQVAAAAAAHTLSLSNALGVFVGLASAAQGEAAFGHLGAALGVLFVDGVTPALARMNLDMALDAGWVAPADAASVIAYAAEATFGLADADAYAGTFAAVLARGAPRDVVAAVDRAYEAGGLSALHAVRLLTRYYGSEVASGEQASHWAVGPELLKLATEGGLGVAEVVGEIVRSTPSNSYLPGQLIGAMAMDADVHAQIAVGHAAGAVVAGGDPGMMLLGLSLTSLDTSRYNTVLLAMAGGGDTGAQLAIGRTLGTPLTTMSGVGEPVDMATAQMLDAGLASGALTAAQLAVVLAGMGQLDFPSPYPVRTASYELNALVTAGVITASDAMAAIGGAIPGLNLGKLVHWLAGTSSFVALHAAAAHEISDLAGRDGTDVIFGYITEITGGTPADVATLTGITGATAAHLFVSIAGFGDAGIQDAVGVHLAPLVSDSSTYLETIDAAVVEGSLSGAGAVHVIASMLGAYASEPGAAVAAWANTHLHTYIADGRVDAATVSAVLIAAAADANAIGQSLIGGAFGAAGLDTSNISAAINIGALSLDSGVHLLLATGLSLDAVDPTFLSARAAVIALVEAGSISVTQVLADMDAMHLGVQQFNTMALGLVGLGTAAEDAAIGAHFGAMASRFGAQFGVGDDPFFTGVLSEVGLAFAKIGLGQMTIAEGIADIESYAAEHNVSSFAGLYALNSLLTGDGNGVSAVRAEMIDKIAVGDLSAELAWRVAQSSTSAFVRDADGTIHFQAADPSALSQQQALEILDWEQDLAFPNEQPLADYIFANDLWASQQLRVNSVSGVSMGLVVEAMRQGPNYYNTGIPGVGTSTYAYDLALASMLETLTGTDLRPGATKDYRVTLEALSTRLLKGAAEDALVKLYVAGTLSFDQVMAALDKEVSASALGDGGVDADAMHAIALAWLHLRARQMIANNPGSDDAADATQFLAQLDDVKYADLILKGYGALLGMASSGADATITAIERQLAYQGATYVIRTHLPPGTTLSERDQALLDAVTTMSNGMAWVFDKHPLGRAYLSIADDPQSAQTYTQIGIQVGAIVGNKLAVDAMFAGTPWGLAITATKLGAQAGLLVLGMGAVQGALGEGPTAYLHGQLTIAAATASLIGNVAADLSNEAAGIIVGAVPNLISFGNAVAAGDVEGMATSIGEVALDYYKLQTGVDLRLQAVVAERFADLIVHLFTGDTGALGGDVKALGSAFLDTITQNPYLAAIGSRMVQFAGTINDALAEINDSYRILGENVVTGLLYVGTGFDEAGNVLRSVAHTVGGFVEDILHGIGIDGYISGATVFADANYNGVLDPGEASTITDATGRYALAAHGAPLVLKGGVDTATKLQFDGTLEAPAGSTVVTPLTTLIQKVAASGNGDPVAAQHVVAAALGLDASLDLNDLDTIAATRTGVAGAAEAFAVASSILNTVSLLEAAGATRDPFDEIAARLAAAAAGSVLNLSDSATVAALAASAGVPAAVLTTAVQLVTASNALLDQAVASASDPVSLLRAVTAVSIAAQGDTSHELTAAGADPTLLASVLAQHTGANLANQVAADHALVGSFGENSASAGSVLLKISADGHGIELALDSGSAVAGTWVRLSALDAGLPAGSTLQVYAVDAHGNLVDRQDHHAGSDVTFDRAVVASLAGVADDHGGLIFLGAQSVYLTAGEQLRFSVLGGDHAVDLTPSVQLAASGDGSLQATIAGMHVSAVSNSALSDAAELADTQRTTGAPFVFLQQGETLDVELAGSSANTNTIGFVRVDVDGATGAWSVGGVAYGETDAFTAAVHSHMDSGFQEGRGGAFDTHTNWTVSGQSGYYAPVLMTQSGETFVIGNANPGGYEYLRMYGENTFGFEDLAYAQGSDFDYNDMVMKIMPIHSHFS